MRTRICLYFMLDIDEIQMNDISLYMAQVKRVPLLTLKEEQKLTNEFVRTKDKRIADKLVNANLRFVVSVARSYDGYHMSLEDLIQEGNCGLVTAVYKFDPQVGTRLITYASWWIHACIKRYVIANTSQVKVGNTYGERAAFFKIRRISNELTIALQRAPTNEELAAALDTTLDTVDRLRGRMFSGDQSLNLLVNDEFNVTQLDCLEDSKPLVTEVFEREELRASVQSQLRMYLNRKSVDGIRKRAIIERRLLSSSSTLKELGERFGVSRERVRQIEEKLTADLRSAISFKSDGVSHAMCV